MAKFPTYSNNWLPLGKDWNFSASDSAKKSSSVSDAFNIAGKVMSGLSGSNFGAGNKNLQAPRAIVGFLGKIASLLGGLI